MRAGDISPSLSCAVQQSHHGSPSTSEVGSTHGLLSSSEGGSLWSDGCGCGSAVGRWRLEAGARSVCVPWDRELGRRCELVCGWGCVEWRLWCWYGGGDGSVGNIGMTACHVLIRAAWAWGSRVLSSGPLPCCSVDEGWLVLRSLWYPPGRAVVLMMCEVVASGCPGGALLELNLAFLGGAVW